MNLQIHLAGEVNFLHEHVFTVAVIVYCWKMCGVNWQHVVCFLCLAWFVSWFSCCTCNQGSWKWGCIRIATSFSQPFCGSLPLRWLPDGKKCRLPSSGSSGVADRILLISSYCTCSVLALPQYNRHCWQGIKKQSPIFDDATIGCHA